MAPKLSRYFYLLMKKPLGRYFQVRSPYYQATQGNQETPIAISSRWKVRFDKAKKATTSIHLPKPVSTDLGIVSVLTNPIGKNGLQSWSMENIYLIRHFYHHTITRRAAKAKEIPLVSPNWTVWASKSNNVYSSSYLLLHISFIKKEFFFCVSRSGISAASYCYLETAK